MKLGPDFTPQVVENCSFPAGRGCLVQHAFTPGQRQRPGPIAWQTRPCVPPRSGCLTLTPVCLSSLRGQPLCVLLTLTSRPCSTSLRSTAVIEQNSFPWHFVSDVFSGIEQNQGALVLLLWTGCWCPHLFSPPPNSHVEILIP